MQNVCVCVSAICVLYLAQPFEQQTAVEARQSLMSQPEKPWKWNMGNGQTMFLYKGVC